MKGYKAFKPGMVCRGKQYAENTVFEENKAEICHSGMHFCQNPFDVLDYYDLVNHDGTFNEFAEVEALSDTKTDDNKKFCTTKLKIGAKLTFGGFVNACVDFIIKKTKKNPLSGANASIGSSGANASIGSSGANASIGSSGAYASIGSSGANACIGSSGANAYIGSSGREARIGSSGAYARIGSSGAYASIGSSGLEARIGSSGEDCVICCAGRDCIAKAKKGSWITLAEWRYDNAKGCYVPSCVKTEYVDGVIIKEDVFYKLIDGKFTEVEE